MQQPLPYITRGGNQQYGTGFGGILRVIRSVVPHLKTVGKQIAGLAKSAGKSLLKTGASTSSKILGDLALGKSFKESAEQRLQEAGAEVQEKVTEKINKMKGKGRRRRRVTTGRKRKRSATTSASRRRGVKRRGPSIQGGSGRKKRRVQKRRKIVTPKTRVVRKHRRRDIFTVG
jgi:hypothetical protein